MIATRTATLRRLIAGARCLLLDFDGPICTVFGGQISAPVVARRLHAIAGDPGGHAPEDPFDVLRAAATIDAELAHRVESAFAMAEREAVQTAPVTDHAAAVIRATRASGRRVAIVSNNSSEAVEQYLDRLSLQVDLIVGRAGPDVSLLKPSPHFVAQASRQLGISPAACALVGDSVIDIIAGKRAHVSTVGHANKPHKRELLEQAGADVVIDELESLAAALRAS